MGVLNITDEWGLDLSQDYRVWWQMWANAYPTVKYDNRKSIGKVLMNELSMHADKYRAMIELGAMHEAYAFDTDKLPAEYGREYCIECIKDFMKILKRVLPGYEYVEIRLTSSGHTGHKILPAMEVRFDAQPAVPGGRLRNKFIIMRSEINNYAYCENIIPDWQSYLSKNRFAYNPISVIKEHECISY